MTALSLAVSLLQILTFGYIFNQIKGVKNWRTYPTITVSYFVGAILSQFAYESTQFTIIYVAVVFSIIYAVVNGHRYNVLNLLLMLNIILFLGIVTAVPLLFMEHNMLYAGVNIIIYYVVAGAVSLAPVDKWYTAVYSCWNRSQGNRYLSVTVRNVTLIVIYLSITAIGIFVQEIFINMIQ